jgi:exoribonuclease R
LNGEKYAPKSWQALGTSCSFNERRADDASRDVENWLKTYYMRDKVGEVFAPAAFLAWRNSAFSSPSTISTSKAWCM